jgi:hypothetical protein
MWVKLDDQFTAHPKVARLSDLAFRVHIETMCYCARYLTDGYVPSKVSRNVHWKVLASLVASGLWEPVEDGYRIHDWAEWNPPADAVRARRKRDAERKRAARRDEHGRYGP